MGSAQYRARAVRTLCAALAGALLLFAAAPAIADHVPTNVRVHTAGNKFLVMRWTAASGATGQRVRHKPKSGSDSEWVVSTDLTGRSAAFNVTGLTNGTTYEVQVGTRLGNSGSVYHYSDSVEGTPVVGSYSIADATAAEGASAALTVTLTANAPSADGLTFSVSHNGAADVGTAPTSFTVAAGETTGTLAIPIARDGVEESNETFTVTISTTDTKWAVGDGSGTVTITDTTEEIRFTSTSVTVAEGSPASLTVQRTGSTTAAAPFTYSTAAATGTKAAATSDYTTVSNMSDTIAASSSSKTISVATTADDVVEEDETFKVTLGAVASNGWATGGDATVTISDAADRTAAKVGFGNSATRTAAYTASIGESDGTLNVPVTISHSPSASITFDVDVASGGTATKDTDFSAAASVTFGPSDAKTKNVAITITNDDVDEDNETIALSIAAADAMPDDLGDHYTRHATGSTATLTITDDDTAGVTVTGGPLSLYEGGETDTYTVVLDSRPTADVTITPTSGNTGQAAVSPTSLTFDASSTSDWKTAKTFTVTGGSVTGASNASVTVSHAATSTDSKYPSSMSIDNVAVTVKPLNFSIASTATADEGATATLRVTLSPATPADLQFTVTPTYGSGSGKAAAGDGTVPKTLIVPKDSTGVTLSIPIARDADEEVDETFTVKITTSAPNWEKTADGADTATVTITDTTEELSITRNVTVTEGDTATLTVTRTGSTDRSVPFTVSLHQRVARATPAGFPIGRRITGGADFQAATVGGNLASGAATATVRLATVEDDVDEDAEGYSAVVTAAASTGYRSATAYDEESGVALVIVNDDDTAGATVNPTTLSFPRYETRTYTVALTSRPTAEVTITPTSGAAATATVSPASVTFDTSASAWRTPKQFTVTGRGAGSVSISHAAGSTDAKYSASLSIDSVATTVNLPKPTSLKMTPGAHGGRPALTVSYAAPGPPPSWVPRHGIALQVIEVGGSGVTGTFSSEYATRDNLLNRLVGIRFPTVGANAVRVTGTASIPLKPGTQYSVRGNLVEETSPRRAVRAHSDAVTATTWGLPGAPTVTVTNGRGELYLAWTVPTDLGGTGAVLTGYAVEYKTSAASDRAATTTGDPTTGWVAVAHSGTAASVTVPGLTNGTSYQVRVRAKNGIDPGGAWSTPASGTPSATGALPSTPQALAVESKVVDLRNDNNPVPVIDIRWSAPPTGYKVIPQIKLATTSSWPDPAATASKPAGTTEESLGATSARYSGVRTGARYDVRAHFVDTSDSSVVANSSTSARQVAIAALPGAPTGVSTSARDKGLDVSWTAPASDGGRAITGYKVRWRVKDAGSGSPGSWNADEGVDATGTSHRITGLTNDTEYEVDVRAWNGIRPGGAWSGAATGTPEALKSITLSAAGLVNEDDGTLTVTARLNVPAPTGGVRVTLTSPTTPQRPATAGVDFSLPAAFTIAANQTEGSADIVIVRDTEVESGGENVSITAVTAPSLNANTILFRILDSTGRAALPTSGTLRADSTPAEGGDPVTVTAALNAPAPAGGVVVALNPTGTAVLELTGAGPDYRISQDASTAFNDFEIAEGATSVTFTITVIDDTVDDDGETIVLDAEFTGSELPSTIDSNTLTLTIADNDGLTLSADSTPAEGGDPVTVTASLDSAAPTGGTTVTLSLTGTATGTGAAADYTLSSTAIAIAAGQTEGTTTITIVDDAVDDDAETIVIDARLSDGQQARLTLTIADNDGPPTSLTLSADPAPAEGGDPVTVTATLDSAALAGGTTVTLTATGTATGTGDAADYTLSSPTIAIGEGETEGTATITIVDDAVDDAGETIILNASSGTPALTAAPLTLTIADNDGPATSLTLAVDPPAPAEDAGTVTVTATLDNPALAGGTTVTLSLTGTATGADYTLSSTTIEIDAGETEGTATITIVDDTADDDGETIVIDATSDSPALTANTVTLTITDNDATLTGLTLSAGELTFSPDTTDYAVEVANDVESVSLTPTVAAGAGVTVNGATVASGASSAAIALAVGETIVTIVATPATGVAPVTYTVTITRLALPTDLTLSAGTTPAEDGAPVTVTATLDVPAPTGGTTVTVTVTGTATGAGDEADYTLSATTIEIGEGETEGTATLTIVDDDLDDPDETIVLDAVSDTPALSAQTLTLTIADNDADTASALTLRADAAPAEGGDPVAVTAALNGPAPEGGTTVTLAATGTAAIGTDYTLSATTIAIAAGETSGAATLSVIDDTVFDPDETVILNAASANPELTAPALTLTIADDDAPAATTLTLSAAPEPAEGGAAVTVTVTLDAAAPATGATVMLTATGTAVAGADYMLSPTVIAIAAGATSGAAALSVIDDAVFDPGETIILNAILSATSDTPALTAAPLTLTIADNDEAPTATTLTLTAAPAPAEGGGPVTVTAMLDAAAPPTGVTVTLTVGGTATGADYTVSSTTIEIAAGRTQGTATLTIVDDDVDDPGETIVLDAVSDTPALRAETLTLTIVDNDAATASALTLRADGQPAEGGEPVTVTAALNGPAPAGGTTVTLTATGTAAGTGDEADYTLSATAIVIAAGARSGAARLSVIDDAVFDPDETIILNAASDRPALRAAALTLTIADNDSDGGTRLACKPKPGVPAARVTASGAAGLQGADLEAALSLRENLDGSGQPVVVGCVAMAAAGGAAWDRYEVAAGDGDFRVDREGTLSYVGGGENHERTPERVVLVRAQRVAAEAVVRVRVAIEDADDAGVVRLSGTPPGGAPRVGEALTATLADEDATEAQVRAAQWQWRRRAAGGEWTAIAGATAADYTPVTGDVGRTLQAQATYADRHGRQQAASTPIAAVGMDAGARLLQVGLTGWGRTAAAAAVDVIGRRFTPAAESAVAAALNGQALSLPAAGDAAAQGRLLRGVTEALGVRVSGDAVSFAPPSGAELLSGSAFSVQGADTGGAAVGWGLWGAGGLSRFGGNVDGIEQTGGVLSGYLGADYRFGANALAGLAASYGSLDVDAKTDAEPNAGLTGWLVNVYPYGYWMPAPWLGVWGIAGAGLGHAALDHGDELEGEVRSWLGAAGQRAELLSVGAWSLAAKADGFVTWLTAGGELPAVSAHAWRGRVLLEGGVEVRPSESVLAARVEVGGRLDGGDAERGVGAEAGAEVSYAHTGLGLELGGRGRLLLVHYDRGLSDWGASALLRWAPRGAEVGPAVSVAPRWGASEASWRPEAVALRLSYGVAAAPAGVVRPYAEVDLTGASADYRLGVEGALEY